MCCYQFLLLTLVKFKKNCTQNEKIMNKTTQKSIKKNFFFFFLNRFRRITAILSNLDR